MNVTFLTVGSLKERYWCDALAEYVKRIGAYARFDEINIKEELIKNENDPREVAAALSAEGEKILSKMQRDVYKIALCVEGKQLSSEELAGVLDDVKSTGGKVVFIIGSSHGLAPEVKAAADLKLSVSRLTFPHQLMRVLLAETVYRAMTISAGKSYHK